MIEAARIAGVLGGPGVLGREVHSLDDLNELVEAGLPKAALRTMLRHLFTLAQDRNRILYRVVPQATFKRRIGRLRPAESERTERLARVIASAESVWGNADDSREWLTREHPELGGRKPIEVGLSELGARRVEELLGRLEYGLPV